MSENEMVEVVALKDNRIGELKKYEEGKVYTFHHQVADDLINRGFMKKLENNQRSVTK